MNFFFARMIVYICANVCLCVHAFVCACVCVLNVCYNFKFLLQIEVLDFDRCLDKIANSLLCVMIFLGFLVHF